MKQQLENLFKSLDILSDEEIAEGLTYFKSKRYKKGEILIREGQVCNWMGFVNTGILRNYYLSSKAEEVTYCLTFPEKIVSALSSFISQTPTFENIDALTDGELLIITQEDYYKLVNSSKSWLLFSRVVAEQSYILMENRLLAFQMEEAEKRYKDLIEANPEYIREVPLKYIASYLGVSPRHLSRLRKQLVY